MPDLSLAVIEWPGDDPGLLLLHGLGSNARIWNRTISSLKCGLKVVAPDQRGHGLSEEPDNGYEPKTWVADILAVMDHFGLRRPVVAGHSWGAAVALRLEACHPDRVAGLILVDGGLAKMSDWMPWEQAEVVLRPPDFGPVEPSIFVDRARTTFLAPVWDNDIEEFIQAMLRRGPDGLWRRAFSIPNHMRTVRALYDHDGPALLTAVNCPTAVCVATGDRPEAAEAILKLVAEVGRSKVVVERFDCPHDIPLYLPQQLAQTIDAICLGADGSR